MVLMRIKEVSEFFGGVSEDLRVLSKAFVDGRLCEEGGLYFALKGGTTDGHAFLCQAAENGAIAAVVEREYIGDSFGLTLIKVKDPLEALQMLAKTFVEIRRPLIIGVTGSLGKTTVKEFITALLQGSYAVSKTPNSYNGQIGLPLTILNADPKAEVLVLEMGMSYKHEMDRLVEIASPAIAVITRIAPAHIGHFSSLDEIAQEKAKIMNSKHLQAVFTHEINRKYSCIKKKQPFKKITYGTSQADYFFQQEKEKLFLVSREAKECFDLPFSEMQLRENFLVAALVARYLDVSSEKIQERALALKPFTHRFEKTVLEAYDGAVIIDDSYNNNPISLKTSLQNLPQPQNRGKVIAILGEMRELGSLSKMAHEELGIVALPIVDVLMCYGEETKPLYEIFKKYGKKAMHSLDKEWLFKLLIENLQAGDVVLIKGANSNRLWEILDKVKEKIC